MKNRTIINSRTVSLISILVIVITILGIWLFGVGNHNSVFENSILSTSILSIAFFLFISIGLYKGAKLKDTVGKITDGFDSKKIEDFKNFDIGNGDFGGIDAGDDLFSGIVINILFWVFISILFPYLFWAFSAMFWFTILLFMAMLYWLFFRALRLVFKNAADCKGKIGISILYGFTYTILYNFWIYGVIYFTNFIK